MSDSVLPGWPIDVGDSTANHWVGACRHVVMIFAYEGSHDDVQHVYEAAKMFERVHRQHGDKTCLLFALPMAHPRPPSGTVRNAFVQVAKRLETNIARIAVVVAGSGFATALHRGAVTGILALIRPKVPTKVHSELSEALVYLLGAESPVIEPLSKFCQQRVHPERASTGVSGR